MWWMMNEQIICGAWIPIRFVFFKTTLIKLQRNKNWHSQSMEGMGHFALIKRYLYMRVLNYKLTTSIVGNCEHDFTCSRRRSLFYYCYYYCDYRIYILQTTKTHFVCLFRLVLRVAGHVRHVQCECIWISLSLQRHDSGETRNDSVATI